MPEGMEPEPQSGEQLGKQAEQLYSEHKIMADELAAAKRRAYNERVFADITAQEMPHLDGDKMKIDAAAVMDQQEEPRIVERTNQLAGREFAKDTLPELQGQARAEFEAEMQARADEQLAPAEPEVPEPPQPPAELPAAEPVKQPEEEPGHDLAA
jgi:hypothetical protein